MQKHLRLNVNPSRYHRWLLISLHLVAGLSVALCGLAPPWQIILWLVLSGSVVFAIKRSRAPVVTAMEYVPGGWRLCYRGQWRQACLLPGSFFTYPLLLLQFDIGRRFRPVVVPLFLDSTDAEALRQLRVLLCHGRLFRNGRRESAP